MNTVNVIHLKAAPWDGFMSEGVTSLSLSVIRASLITFQHCHCQALVHSLHYTVTVRHTDRLLSLGTVTVRHYYPSLATRYPASLSGGRVRSHAWAAHFTCWVDMLVTSTVEVKAFHSTAVSWENAR